MLPIDNIYTLAIIGDEYNNANAFTYALAQSISRIGKVVSGDYLEPKKLAGCAKVFHIGCYFENNCVDLINCPLTLPNFSICSQQADRIIWVISPDEISDNLRNAVEVSSMLGSSEHIVVLNTANIDPELSEDEEIIQVMMLEAHDLFSKRGIELSKEVTLSLSEFSNSVTDLPELDSLARYILSDLAQVHSKGDHSLMYIEQCYNLKDSRGKYTTIAYGPVRGGEIALDQTLTLLGYSSEHKEVRVAELEMFGQSVKMAYTGGSVSVRFHSIPKDLLKAGQVLTEKPELFFLLDEITLSLSVRRSDSFSQVIGSLKGGELYAGIAHASAAFIDYQPHNEYKNKGRLKLKTQKLLLMIKRQPVIVGNDNNILAWGTLVES